MPVTLYMHCILYFKAQYKYSAQVNQSNFGSTIYLLIKRLSLEVTVIDHLNKHIVSKIQAALGAWSLCIKHLMQ